MSIAPCQPAQSIHTSLRQGFDIERNEVIEDLTGTMGFLKGVSLCLRLQRRGLLYMGLPCNSHTFMSCSQHKRGYFRPCGDETYGFVVEGNMIAFRAGILILLAIARSVVWLLENPGNSRCVYLPVLEYLLKFQNLLGSSRTGWSGPYLLVTFSKSRIGCIADYSCEIQIKH